MDTIGAMDRVAVITDIHANAVALAATLERIESMGVDSRLAGFFAGAFLAAFFLAMRFCVLWC